MSLKSDQAGGQLGSGHQIRPVEEDSRSKVDQEVSLQVFYTSN